MGKCRALRHRRSCKRRSLLLLVLRPSLSSVTSIIILCYYYYHFRYYVTHPLPLWSSLSHSPDRCCHEFFFLLTILHRSNTSCVCSRRDCGPIRLRGSRARRVDAEERRRHHRCQTDARWMDGRVQRWQERNVPRQLCKGEYNTMCLIL